MSCTSSIIIILHLGPNALGEFQLRPYSFQKASLSILVAAHHWTFYVHTCTCDEHTAISNHSTLCATLTTRTSFKLTISGWDCHSRQLPDLNRTLQHKASITPLLLCVCVQRERHSTSSFFCFIMFLTDSAARYVQGINRINLCRPEPPTQIDLTAPLSAP